MLKLLSRSFNQKIWKIMQAENISNSFKHTGVPYFSQWESRDLVKEIVEEKIPSRNDPLWRLSGASNPEEYEYWSRNMCGMACLKSILKYTQDLNVPITTLGKKCQEYGGYITQESEIDGLFYEPFTRFIKSEYGLNGKVKKHLSVEDIVGELSHENFVIASVSHLIRNQKKMPSSKGGHLILMLGYNLLEHKFLFHNPSGYNDGSQEYVEIDFDTFETFFAGRGTVIVNPNDSIKEDT